MGKGKKTCAQCSDSFTDMELSAAALQVGSAQAAQAFANALKSRASVRPATSSPVPASPPRVPPPQAMSRMSKLPRVSRLEERPSSGAGCAYLGDQVIATPGGSFKVR